MKYVDEYRDATLAPALVGEILSVVRPDRHYRLMEACGGHTHAIYRYGIDELLPANVELVHGPGCPVSVLPTGRLDEAIAIAQQPGVIFACFGDLLRVSGSGGTLLDAEGRGADVRMVYSSLDALRIAKANPTRTVVFAAIGFETTAPATALTIKRAKAENVTNFLCLSNHLTIVPPVRALLDAPDLRLDGFIAPGNLSAVIGTRAYEFIPAVYDTPVVVAGPEPLDVLQAIHMLLVQLNTGCCEVENQYRRVVSHAGNLRALEVLGEVFRPRPRFAWRGLGVIRGSGLRLSDAYAEFDAELRFTPVSTPAPEPAGCRCGQVLAGAVKPWECAAFGTSCTPDSPIGTCMVSSEGACAAYYDYGRFAREREAV